jgi:hypothetical protein
MFRPYVSKLRAGWPTVEKHIAVTSAKSTSSYFSNGHAHHGLVVRSSNSIPLLQCAAPLAYAA